MSTRWTLLVGASSLLLACSVITTPGDTTGAGRSSSSSGATSTEDPRGTSSGAPDASSDAPAQPAPPPTTPKELADTAWTWVTSSGGQTLAFAADGAYTMDVVLDAHPGDGCGTEYFTRHEGWAEFASSALTLRGTASVRKKEDSCTGKVLADDPIEPQLATYAWRLEAGADGADTLVLRDDAGGETTFRRDAR